MRMWMVDPKIMCQKHLCGEHVELHMLVGHLKRGRRVDGYVRTNCVQPKAIARRHKALAEEMERRGYKHVSPLRQPRVLLTQHPEAVVDSVSSLVDLGGRCVMCRERMVAL
jgi:hypothetical protein